MDRNVRCREDRRRGENPQGYRVQRFSCVLGMFSRVEVKVLYPT